MQKISTMQARQSKNFQAGQLTIGLDLGDRWSFYCVLDEVGKVILEQKLPTTQKRRSRSFRRYLEVASPWRQGRIRPG